MGPSRAPGLELAPGERAAFTAFYVRQAPRVHRFLRDLLGDATLAADATQGTFARVFARGDLFRDAVNASGALALGDSSAHETVLLFTDFECPYCKRLDAELRALVAEEKDVRVFLRNRPLPMHPHARLAAKAALAADAQGKLGPYAEALFQHQNALDRAALSTYARDVGLDVARFEKDIDAPEIEARLAEDEALAEKLDVRGTPTSFVSGHRIIGAQPSATFDDALSKARAR